MGYPQETSKAEVDHGGRNRSHRATLQHTQAGCLISKPLKCQTLHHE